MATEAASALQAQWWGTYATIFAGLVALVIPFIMHYLEGVRAKDERANASEDAMQERVASLAELWRTIEAAVRLYLEIRQAAEHGNPNPNLIRNRQIAVEADATIVTLENLLRATPRDSELLVAGSAAIVMARGTAQTARLLLDDQLFPAFDAAKSFHDVAQLANARNEIARVRYGIERAAGLAHPII